MYNLPLIIMFFPTYKITIHVLQHYLYFISEVIENAINIDFLMQSIFSFFFLAFSVIVLFGSNIHQIVSLKSWFFKHCWLHNYLFLLSHLFLLSWFMFMINMITFYPILLSNLYFKDEKMNFMNKNFILFLILYFRWHIIF